MRIMPVPNFNINFKSHNPAKDEGRNELDVTVLGYDDEPSRDKRKYVIRHDIDRKIAEQAPWAQYNDYRISEYKLKELTDFLLAQPKKVSKDAMSAFGMFVAPNVYRGQTLYNQPEALKELKKAGIERVIDLCGYQRYEENCKAVGLEYYCLFQGRIWDEDESAGKEKGEYLERKRWDYERWGLGKGKIEESLKWESKNFDEHSNEFIEQLITLVDVINKGYVYMGCEFGTYHTTDILFLNNLFNPKSEYAQYDDYFPRSSLSGFLSSEGDVEFAANLYKKLTPEHKARMGWSEEFDAKLKAKLENRKKTIEKEELERYRAQYNDDDDENLDTDPYDD